LLKILGRELHLGCELRRGGITLTTKVGAPALLHQDHMGTQGTLYI
jgi:hypothetical protein